MCFFFCKLAKREAAKKADEEIAKIYRKTGRKKVPAEVVTEEDLVQVEDDASEDEFHDLNNTLNMSRDGQNPGQGGLNGGATPPPPRVPDFDMINDSDKPEALAKLGSVKVPWSKDIKYWFSEIETQMDIIQIKSQMAVCV